VSLKEKGCPPTLFTNHCHSQPLFRRC